MNQETRAFALKAAAQVAFVTAGAVGVGCSVSGAGTSEDDFAARADCVRATPDDGAPPRPSDAGPAKTAEAPKAADAACDAETPTTEPTCRERLATRFPEGDAAWWEGRTRWFADGGVQHLGVTDPALAACCAAMGGATDEDGFRDLEALRSSGCCKVEGWAAGSSCTPWGPPTPPVYRGRARRLAALAEQVA